MPSKNPYRLCACKMLLCLYMPFITIVIYSVAETWSQFSHMEEESAPVPKTIRKGLKKGRNSFLDMGKVNSSLINWLAYHLTRKHTGDTLELDISCVNSNIGPGFPALETLHSTCASLNLSYFPCFIGGRSISTLQWDFFRNVVKYTLFIDERAQSKRSHPFQSQNTVVFF